MKMLRMISIIVIVLTAAVSSLRAGQNTRKPSKAEIIQKSQNLRIPFITNTGQIDKRVAFYTKTFGGSVFVTEEGEVVYTLPGNAEKQESRTRKPENRISQYATLNQKSAFYNPQSNIKRMIAIKEEFVGGNIPGVNGECEAVAKVSIFVGDNPSKWKNNIPVYEVVNMGEVYRGIGLKLKAYGGNVEKVFCVKPGADPELIKVRLSAVKDCGVRNAECGIENPKSEFQNPKFQTNQSGELEVKTELGVIKFTKPIAYQEINGKRVYVDAEYCIEKSEVGSSMPEVRSQRREAGGMIRIGGREKWMRRKGAYLTFNSQFQTENLQPESKNSKYTRSFTSPTTHSPSRIIYGFKVAGYDKTKDLIIDPLLASTYLGGLSSDYGYSIAIDSKGNIYVAGYTEASDFPTTTGAYNVSYNYSDIFVTKLNGDLSQVLASTYLGGSSEDYVRSIAIDSCKNVIYVTGQTLSSAFPTTANAYDTKKNGSSDAFLVRLSGDLAHLLASTFLGGSSDEFAYSVVSDSNGINIYVTGRTSSSNFPTTPGAYDTTFDNGDVFISKFNWNLTQLLASTYLGGTNNDYGHSIAISTDRNIYVSGETWSSDFPASIDAYDTSFNGGFGDVFVSKFNWDLTHIIASTFLGGSSDDSANAIATDSRGNIYVTGQTESLDFPTTPAAYNTSFHNGDAFVSKLNGNLTALLASTFLGGADDDVGNSIAIGTEGNIYVAGHTGSSDFPTTPGSYSTSKGILFDAFISKLSGDLTILFASTYLGGNYRDIARSIALDSGGNIYVTGETRSSNFPTTPGAYDHSYNGDVNTSYDFDAFVSKLDCNLSAQTTAATKK
ncbi:MAG: SBBP repeat-containing protein [Planctomycetes bacterium]|nr:SBBP repeat-containing protein [Planctomycetota bacterium]